jgi:HTH-type transcriptional regulator/antitoxin HigA
MVTSVRNQYKPDYAIHPCEILEETLISRGISKSQLAERSGITKKTISQIINGKAPVTPDTALMLEKVLGVSADIWNNLDSQYRLFNARMEKQNILQQCVEWAAKFPLNELKKRKAITQARDKGKAVDELLSFFGVASIDTWQELYGKIAVSYRRAKAYEGTPESIASWLRIAELSAEEREIRPYNRNIFRKNLSFIRALTNEGPDYFIPIVKEQCADAGVVLVLIPELPKTRVSGATRWLNVRRAMIALSLRYKSNDQFWFTFFHEAGHLFIHEKKRVFIDYQTNGEDTLEKEADDFARNLLIPPDLYKDFIEQGSFFKPDIIQFAETIGVAPGIVTRILQYDGHIKYEWHNDLKQKIELKEVDRDLQYSIPFYS